MACEKVRLHKRETMWVKSERAEMEREREREREKVRERKTDKRTTVKKVFLYVLTNLKKHGPAL